MRVLFCCRALVFGLALVCVPHRFDMAAQGRDTLWTRAVGEGSTIVLTWDKDHPWDKQLASNRASLVARYSVPTQREVNEVVAVATPNGKDRVLRFVLPDSVRG